MIALIDWVIVKFGSERAAYNVSNGPHIQYLIRRRFGELDGWRILNKMVGVTPDGQKFKR